MAVSVFDKLQPISKKDRIVESLREAIISGRIASGEAIVEGKLAQQFGVGQPLVREALLELEFQGFVQRLAYRGTRVTKLSREDIIQIFRLRDELEAIAIEWAKQNAAPEDLAELKKLASEMKRGAERLDLAYFYERDLNFHRKIWQLSGNKYLVEALERVVVPLFAFFLMKTTRESKSYVESADSHLEIVEAFEHLDAKELRNLMDQSLAHWREDMLVKLNFDNE